ncbi:MAG: hypothetical protein EON54_02625 [Alcaligenaceae bacterium]|nr:MAG: hypothetical protein EON54_02625 [Alcaligenaceae bacterium]
MTLRPFRSTAFIACVLTLALWFASTLGLVHGVVHTPGLAQGPSQVSTPATSVAGHTHKSLLGSVAALFTDHHEGDAQCRLYDQLSHGPAAVSVPLIVLPLVLPTATFDFFAGEALARWVALFQARGPPSPR